MIVDERHERRGGEPLRRRRDVERRRPGHAAHAVFVEHGAVVGDDAQEPTRQTCVRNPLLERGVDPDERVGRVAPRRSCTARGGGVEAGPLAGLGEEVATDDVPVAEPVSSPDPPHAPRAKAASTTTAPSRARRSWPIMAARYVPRGRMPAAT